MALRYKISVLRQKFHSVTEAGLFFEKWEKKTSGASIQILQRDAKFTQQPEQLTRADANRQCEMERINWIGTWFWKFFSLPHPRYVRLVLRFCIDPALHCVGGNTQ